MKRRYALPALLFAFAACPSPIWANSMPREAQSVGDPRRNVALAGGQNFRELGGYRTIDGHRVNWGLIYRSGAMNRLAPANLGIIRQRRIDQVLDLRGSDERRLAPVVWPAGHALTVHATDYRLTWAASCQPPRIPS